MKLACFNPPPPTPPPRHTHAHTHNQSESIVLAIKREASFTVPLHFPAVAAFLHQNEKLPRVRANCARNKGLKFLLKQNCGHLFLSQTDIVQALMFLFCQVAKVYCVSLCESSHLAVALRAAYFLAVA